MLSTPLSRIMAGVLALPALLSVGRAADPKDRPKVPLGLPPMVWPKQNPYSQVKWELGRFLFFDPRLSADQTVSCASCHDPQKAFTDGTAVSTGIRAQKGNRNSQTVINRGYSLAQFWDGRAATLEDQAKGPIDNPVEMGSNHEAVVARLSGMPGYRALFAKAFGTEEITIDRAAQAIACFERTLLSGNSPYDRYKSGDKKALTPEQIHGMSVFFDKAKCDRCHEGANFTLNAYANIGVGSDKPDPDLGRYSVTHDPRDWGAFKTPTLREIEHTAPYMHDGSLKTLEEVVEFYNKGAIKNKNLDAQLKPLNLTDQEKSDLVAFLKTLSGQGWQNIKAPDELPK